MGFSLDFQGSNAVAEMSAGDRGTGILETGADPARDKTSTGDRVTGIPETGADPARDGMYEAKQEAHNPDEGQASVLMGYVADRASDRAEKAKEMANRVGETAKKTMDGAWKTARETTEEIKEAAAGGGSLGEEEKRGPNYENLVGDRNVEDLRRRAGGYDKAE